MSPGGDPGWSGMAGKAEQENIAFYITWSNRIRLAPEMEIILYAEAFIALR
jgi:hypothetical protein